MRASFFDFVEMCWYSEDMDVVDSTVAYRGVTKDSGRAKMGHRLRTQMGPEAVTTLN